MSVEEVIHAVTELCRKHSAKEILLFGSKSKGTAREVLRKAFQAELIASDLWMEMLDVRNRLIHDYDGEVIKQYCDKIVDVYIDTLYEFRQIVKHLNIMI